MNNSNVHTVSNRNRPLAEVSGHDNSPIGIFDSGYGGLTVAREIAQLLPNESSITSGTPLAVRMVRVRSKKSMVSSSR